MDTIRFRFQYLNDQSEFGVYALSGLASYIDPALRILHARLRINPHLSYQFSLNVGRESFSHEQITVLNSCLKDVLNLFSKYVNNTSQAITSEKQNQFFLDGFKYDNFVDCLIDAIERERGKKLKESFKKSPVSPNFDTINQIIIKNNAERKKCEGLERWIGFIKKDDFNEDNLPTEKEIRAMMLKNASEQEECAKLQKKWIEAAKQRIKDFKYEKNRLTEKEVRAIGVLYAMELILDRWRVQEQQPIIGYEILRFAGAVSGVQKLFNFREQYVGSIIGGQQKNDHFASQRELAKIVIEMHPSAKPKQLRQHYREEAKKHRMSENMIPPDSTLDRWIREIRSAS